MTIKSKDIAVLAKAVRAKDYDSDIAYDVAKARFGERCYQVFELVVNVVASYGINPNATDQQLCDMFRAVGVEVEE